MFSKHWWKDDENLLFIQVPLGPSSFWTTSLRICLQWLLILFHIPPQPNFRWHLTTRSPSPYAPPTYCPSAPEFYRHLRSGSSALSHHSSPCRSTQNKTANFTRSFFQAICPQKDTVRKILQLMTGTWRAGQTKGYAQNTFSSAPNALCASPPPITYICCRIAIKSKQIQRREVIILGKFTVKKIPRDNEQNLYLPHALAIKSAPFFQNRSSVG